VGAATFYDVSRHGAAPTSSSPPDTKTTEHRKIRLLKNHPNCQSPQSGTLIWHCSSSLRGVDFCETTARALSEIFAVWPKTLRGLSHREWGDAADTLAILVESANPSQGRLRGATSAELVVSGEDQMYARAAKLGRLFVPFEGKGIHLSVRVARHVATVNELIRTFSEITPDRGIELDGVPAYDDMVKQGIGTYL
jgi:hypothetical protein